ncbi:hypothetical protein BC830DRAFT_51791 [Chytriomyces sp. MP71]|nr:hypothetical protein BC830DRAFT_51791 [Chytriomyces sp. MP71]
MHRPAHSFNLTFPDSRSRPACTTPVTVAELLTLDCTTGYLDIATLSGEGDAIAAWERCFFVLSPERKTMAMFTSSNGSETALDEMRLSQESVLLAWVDRWAQAAPLAFEMADQTKKWILLASTKVAKTLWIARIRNLIQDERVHSEEYPDFLNEYVSSPSDSNFGFGASDSAIQGSIGRNSDVSKNTINVVNQVFIVNSWGVWQPSDRPRQFAPPGRQPRAFYPERKASHGGLAAYQVQQMQLSLQYLQQDQQSYQLAQPNQFYRPVHMARVFSDQGADTYQNHYGVADTNLRRGSEAISEPYPNPHRPPFRNSEVSTASSSVNSLLSPVSMGIPGGGIFGSAGESEGADLVRSKSVPYSLSGKLPPEYGMEFTNKKRNNLKAAMAATYL